MRPQIGGLATKLQQAQGPVRIMSFERASAHRLLKPILCVKDAEDWVNRMRPEERAILKVALDKTEIPSFDSIESGSLDGVVTTDYIKVAVQNGLPFIGFGFLDNAIMIVAGDYIDITIGVTLGISTMAAAALGNAISDVAGIGLAAYVERISSRLGIAKHALTAVQLSAPSFRFAANMGRGLGVAIGCLIGMLPLLFLTSKDEKAQNERTKADDAKKEDDKQTSSQSIL